MTGDGRGQLLPPAGWLARLFAWLKARPMLAMFGTLVAGIGVASARARYYQTAAAKAQKKADLATGKASQLLAREAQAVHEKGIHQADAAAGLARRRDDDAGEVVTDADAELTRLSEKWKGRRKWPTE